MTKSMIRPGQHVKVYRGLYEHHAIFAGHVAGRPVVLALEKPEHGGQVRLVAWEEFAAGAIVEFVHHRDGFSLAQSLGNAMRLLGQQGYHLLDWNCEHFATWCSTGKPRSPQIERLIGLSSLAAICAILARAA